METSNSLLANLSTTFDMDYEWTSKFINSHSETFHMITLGIPLSLIAIVETIVEIVKIPLKFLGLIDTYSKGNPSIMANTKNLTNKAGKINWSIVLGVAIAIGGVALGYYFYRTNLFTFPTNGTPPINEFDVPPETCTQEALINVDQSSHAQTVCRIVSDK